MSAGEALRRGGLTSRALAAWAGTDRLSALPAPLPAPTTPASALLALFVAGAEVPAARVPGELAELVDIAGDRARARLSILPLGRSLIVCDRLDTHDGLEIVCWPDDSSYHLALAIPPGRRASWLDLGCGSAFAPLYRPELATHIVATDVNARAVRYAALGAALSGVSHLACHISDLGAAVHGTFELVTCNAPIPPPGDPFIARMLTDARTLVAPGGMVIVHAVLDALLPALCEHRGDRVIARYTPDGVARHFGVAWWRPDAGDRLIARDVELTPARPHVTHLDRSESTE